MTVEEQMKKLIILLMALLMSSPLAFANNQTSWEAEVVHYLSECDLNPERWEPVNASKDLIFLSFFDKNTIATKGPDAFEVWVCNYMTGKEPCTLMACKNKNIDKISHYHYNRVKYDTKALTMTLLATMAQDRNHEVFFSIEIPDYQQKTHTVPPESLAEMTMNGVMDYLKNQKGRDVPASQSTFQIIDSGTSATGKYFKVKTGQVEWTYSQWRDDYWRYKTNEMKGNTSIVFESRGFEQYMKQLGWSYEKVNGYYR